MLHFATPFYMKTIYSYTKSILMAALALCALSSQAATDITGKWKADFETQIGHLKYVYEFKVDGD